MLRMRKTAGAFGDPQRRLGSHPESRADSSRHCSSTGMIQSISGTVNTVRRLGALPRDDLPHRTNSAPYRPNAGIFGLCRSSAKSNPHASRRRNPYA